MSSFAALNIEPDEDIEEEVDDTKEIQIEEALKLYQIALKLHSQGPAFYAQAKEAYAALLKSEIFKYPESISDYQRTALQDAAADEAGLDDAAPDTLAEIDLNNTAASALPQTIYLSYKNHGQFLLDLLRETLQSTSTEPESNRDVEITIAAQSRSAVAMFAEALERDDTDLDLWRKSARIGSALKSCRLARYCLESVLVGDDNELEVRSEQLGLEEAFATEDLQKVLQALRDDVSVSQAPPLKKPRKALFRFLKDHTDPYPYLPALPQDLPTANHPQRNLQPISRRMITVPDKTWTTVGKAILQVIIEEEHNDVDLEPGRALGIELPSESHTLMAQVYTTSQELAMVQSNAAISQDVEIAETKANQLSMEEIQPSTKSQELAIAESVEDQSSIDQRAESQLMESLEGHSRQDGEPPNQADSLAADEIDPKSSIGNSRKRSSASVINDEGADGGRTKSRRIRARESNAESLLQTEEVTFDQAKYYEDRLEVFSHADDWLFSTVGRFLSIAGVEDLGTIEDLRNQVCPINIRKESVDLSKMHMKGPDAVLFRDLRNALMSWDEDKSRSALEGDGSTSLQDLRGMNRSGLAIFLEHSRRPIQKPGKDKILTGGQGLSAFARQVNNEWLHLHEVSFGWMARLLQPGLVDADINAQTHFSAKSPYTTFLWPDTLKETVVQVMIREDEYIYEKMLGYVTDLEERILYDTTSETLFRYTGEQYSQMVMIQTLYELHLDVYALINNPNSEVDQGTRVLQRDRLARWGHLSRTAVCHFMDHGPNGEARTKIVLRHLWSSTFHCNMAEDIAREHILLCLQELKNILASLGNVNVTLMNNAIMPEISSAALDQEISRLNSMDFFMRIFGSEAEDPVSLIESIEPILEPSSVEFTQVNGPAGDGAVAPPASHLQEMASFLDRGDATLRLFLWRRLQDAYHAIDYTPKVVSCQLRSIETIVKEIQGNSYLEASADSRQIMLLRWLKSINDLLIKILPQVLHHPEKAFECIDMTHLRSSMSTVAKISRLLHSFALYEDAVRVGQVPPPELRGPLSKSLEHFKEKLRDMQIRCWVLQYTLLKECMLQEKMMFDTPADGRVQYLRAVHNAVGVRSGCKYAEKVLLKLMKSELLSLQSEEGSEADISQVLFDLHGFKFSAHDGTVDHGCPPERLDRGSASLMVDFVMLQVNRVSIRDISKSDLKTTIDKVQQALGSIKHSAWTFNRRILSAYLKSPINPSQLFRAVQGVGGLSFMSVPTESARIAQKGWYFLLGHASLTKFRTQKRLSPVPTNDLDDAITYFRQDLEHGVDRWETWYRLAQTYDSKLEEDITWSADKINNNRSELVVLQRNAIHCYAMAVTSAIKSADEDPKSRATLSDLYTDFGIRLYASSREPLSMGPFSLAEFIRHFSDLENQQMYKGKPFREMKPYSVWTLACYIFRRAMIDRPNYWMNHYMLSKCLWKMFNSDVSARGSGKVIGVDNILDSLLDAIETVPQRKDNRSDPVFEPHFRLVSVLHKLVRKGKIEPAEAGKILSDTPWARKLSPPQDRSGWQPYILDVLKNLKNADKSNWHHRFLARAAHVLYDDQQDATGATAAKNELMPQIFTKTMTLQVWRPEFERPGRHFIYTTRYVYFFVSLLEHLSDRASLDQLLRRVRKRQGDFIDHTKLWEDICLVYAKLIRQAGDIPEKHEDGVFKPVSWEDFVTNSARLEGLKDLSTTSSSILELLREAVELKKLNNSLMKVTMFEDLIADIYARLYEANVPRFIEQANEENRERMKVDHLLMVSEVAADTPTPPTSAPPSEAPAPRGRTKGIARRDIQKRAEAIVTRHLGTRPVAVKATAVTTEEEARTAPATETTLPLPIRDNLRDGLAEAASGAQSSVPASIHDSADDESELSEIDDERLANLKAEQGSLLFPNLLSEKSPDPTSELSAPVSADGEEVEEGVGAGEDDGDDDEEANENEIDLEGETGVAEDEEEEAEGVEEGEGEDEEGEGEQEDVDMEGEEGEGEEGADEDIGEGNENEGATEDQDETAGDGDENIDVDVDVDVDVDDDKAVQPSSAQDGEE